MIGAISLIGLAAFLYPFVLPTLASVSSDRPRAGEAPVIFAAVTVLCLIAIVLQVQPGAAGMELQSAAKTAALLGLLVAVDASLRLVPSFLGASPIFALMILTGAVFGPAIGFQMGALTLLVSAFITGGMGPWLPFQMIAAGWVGMTAGWLPRLPHRRRYLAVLAVFGAAWGFGYGAIMNLWSWPFASPGLQTEAGLYWVPGMSAAETLATYGRFYLVTSFAYDAFRAIGNAALILLAGGPVLTALERFARRFAWQAPASWPGATITDPPLDQTPTQ